MPNSNDFTAAYKGRRVCVTGGAGFIGSHLVDALITCGAQVRVLDDLSNGLESNLSDVRDRISFIHGSILDPDALYRALDGAEVVFHLAAVAAVQRSIAEPALYGLVNTLGTQRVLEAARRARAGRVVYAASSSVYGDQEGLPRVEAQPVDPRSPYAATKCAGEHLVRAYACCYGLSSISLRYFNIFGPRQRPDSAYAAAIPLFAQALTEGRKLLIYGDGSQSRDFTFVANAVHANLLAGATAAELQGQVVNVACGRRTTILELADIMADLLGVECECEFAPERTGDVKHSFASLDAARKLIGYEPLVDLRAGLKETLASYASQRGQ